MNKKSTLTRRNFLQLGGIGLAGLFLPENFKNIEPGSHRLERVQQGRVTESTIKIRTKPELGADVVSIFWKDIVLPITGVVISDDKQAHNRVWYQVNGNGYAYSGSIQPVQTILNPSVKELPREINLVEVSVPYTDARLYPNQSAEVKYRYYFETTHWVDRVILDKEEKTWYRVVDEKFDRFFYIEAEHVHLISDDELGVISPGVPNAEKRLEVHLGKQMVIAYEKERVVFMTRASTGGSFNNGIFETPLGTAFTFHKRPSAHMAAGDLASNGFDLPGVPWVCYITESGVAFHGTYWHNDFGKPRSHGCINVSSRAAKWIYRWTQPIVLPDETYRFVDYGTRVDVIP